MNGKAGYTPTDKQITFNTTTMKKIFIIPLLLLLTIMKVNAQEKIIIKSNKHGENDTTIIKFRNTGNIFKSLLKLNALRNLERNGVYITGDSTNKDSVETIIIRTIETDDEDIVDIITKDANGNVIKRISLGEDAQDEIEDFLDDFDDAFEDFDAIYLLGDELFKRKKAKKKKNVETDWFALDIGLNGLLFEGSPSLPTSLSNLELDPLRSVHVNVGVFQQKVNIYKHRVGFVYGVNYDNNDYRFSNDIDFKVNDAGDSISFKSRQSQGFDRNKLTTRFLTIPVAFRFDFNPKIKRGGHITIGAHAGYRLTSFFKTVRFDDGKRKTKLRDDYLLNNTRFGAYVKVGYKGFNIFGNYIFTPMFRDNTGPVLNTFSFGLSLGGF